jgi:hypothetical protein
MALFAADTPIEQALTRAKYDPAKIAEIIGIHQRGRAAGLSVAWEYDNEPCIGCDCGSDDCACASGADHLTEWAYITDPDDDRNLLASLGSICEASDDYRYFVASELLTEALHEIDRRAAVALDQTRVINAMIPAYGV